MCVNCVSGDANELNCIIVSGRMGRLREPPDRNIDVCCVALRGCGGAFRVN